MNAIDEAKRVSYLALGRPPSALATASEVGVRLAAFALTIGLSALSWRYFEKPLVKRGQRLKY